MLPTICRLPSGGSVGLKTHKSTAKNRIIMTDSTQAEQGTSAGDHPSPFSPTQISSPLNILPGIKPPGKLDIRTNAADNWKACKQTWQNYAIITNLDAQPEAYKVALFLHCIGPEALKVYNGVAFATEEGSKSLTRIFEMFDLHTIGEINIRALQF